LAFHACITSTSTSDNGNTPVKSNIVGHYREGRIRMKRRRKKVGEREKERERGEIYSERAFLPRRITLTTQQIFTCGKKKSATCDSLNS
jgi:hypothetical protein